MTRRDAIDLALLIAVVILFRLSVWPLFASWLSWAHGWR